MPCASLAGTREYVNSCGACNTLEANCTAGKKEREPAGPNRVVPAEGGGEVEYRGKTGAENKRRGNDRNKVKEKEKEGNGRE